MGLNSVTMLLVPPQTVIASAAQQTTYYARRVIVVNLHIFRGDVQRADETLSLLYSIHMLKIILSNTVTLLPIILFVPVIIIVGETAGSSAEYLRTAPLLLCLFKLFAALSTNYHATLSFVTLEQAARCSSFFKRISRFNS